MGPKRHSLTLAELSPAKLLPAAILGSALLAVLASLGGCAGSERAEDEEAHGESAIIGGSVTSNYPAVGAFTRAHKAYCTGTVIAPRVVLTAAHCLGGGPFLALTRFGLGPVASIPHDDFAVVRVVPHPDYDRETLANDIGIAILGRDAPVEPIAFHATKLDTSWIGRELEFVGYGVTDLVEHAGGGRKRTVTIPIATISPTQISYTSQHGMACVGDSGGPALARDDQGKLTIVGVTSYGDPACATYGVETRVDAYAQFVADASQPAAR